MQRCLHVEMICALSCFLAASKNGLSDVSQDVLSLVSHAAEQRLRNILEKVSTISLHRLEVYRVCESSTHVLVYLKVFFCLC